MQKNGIIAGTGTYCGMNFTLLAVPVHVTFHTGIRCLMKEIDATILFTKYYILISGPGIYWCDEVLLPGSRS
jgi:hypothetical protein